MRIIQKLLGRGQDTYSNDMTNQARRNRALAFCDNHIQRYENLKWRSGKGYYYLSIITILLSSLIPVILLTQNNLYNNMILKYISTNSTLISATFSAVIAITTGILTLYQWRENYPRYSYTLQRLKNEKAKFETMKIEEGAEGDKLINKFINDLDGILLGEVIEWRSLMSKIKEDDLLANKRKPPVNNDESTERQIIE
ncbi:MAG: hypothetical protein A4E45_00074 [Methanosaeta sp. PtaB.Bin039]|nr:MAG: hypothetical protein A4E45_00074 [Methanosaeta sp. PtaB.Bin039]OPY47610.1 MAG: hypothetical protein A4E47_00204 [Methanosaeta sp. PtaU1.Bin028]HOT06885.1 DUF4231 domain-containing protein [Methanotrichaceae archaeon]HQF16493.1 DUF4231 domain-containing protein [Methanotrichaceae archaeon]HQI91916.1 DUF4231 domain-containing protein [Methanotrichaceae archaeon]